MTFTVATVLFGASFVNSLAPGPCIILTLSRSSRAGMAAGLSITVGVLLAEIALACLSVSVIFGLVLVSGQTLETVRWAGFAALLWLAAKMIRSGKLTAPSRCMRRGILGDVASGLLVGVTSPYNLIFLLALLPQFLPATDVTTGQAALAVAIFALAATSAQLLAVCCGSLLCALFRQYGVWIDRAGGAMLAAFAVTLLVARIE